MSLSLMGKARRSGVLDLRVHDLRDVTTDRHRTVDDTPFGGGAGMVMTPEPWASTVERLLADGEVPRLIVPAPSGQVFDQELAQELAAEPRLIFACGRYEGIDERVFDWASERMRVTPVSIGDYVLYGGEVAVLVMLEAIVRLIPGVLGNPDSLVEESHTGGLLEYPLYTKPASWRGRDVPPVLLSGDHAAIAGWRHEQRLIRTAQRRPDLLAASSALTAEDLAESADGLRGCQVRPAVPGDAGEILTLQRACWVAESLANPGVEIPALTESLDDVRTGLAEWATIVVRKEGRLIGSGRGRLIEGDVWDIGRLMVAPDLQGLGLGRWLLRAVERLAPPTVARFVLFTGANSTDNLRMYRKAGYRPLRGDAPPGAVLLGRRATR